MNINNVISMLRDIIKNSDFDRMNKSSLKGFLGEIYVLQKLENEGLSPNLIGKQAKIDIEIGKSKTLLKIDVKTSARKIENGNYIWGWTLKTKTKDIACTHFICVAMDDGYKPRFYCVIPSKSICKATGVRGQYSNVEKSFVIVNKKLKEPNKHWQRAINISQKLLNSGKAIKVFPSGSLTKALGIKSLR